MHVFCQFAAHFQAEAFRFQRLLKCFAFPSHVFLSSFAVSSVDDVPLSIHFSIARSPLLYICYLLKTSAARMILRMIQCLAQSLKAELISRPRYLAVPAGRHEAISGPWCPPTVPAALSLPHPSLLSGIYPPLSSPHKVTPSEIFYISPLSLSLRFPLPMMDGLHTLGCLSLSIMACD